MGTYESIQEMHNLLFAGPFIPLNLFDPQQSLWDEQFMGSRAGLFVSVSFIHE